MTETIGQRLRRLREEKGWDAQDLACVTEIPLRRIMLFEQNDLTPNAYELHMLDVALIVDDLEGDQ